MSYSKTSIIFTSNKGLEDWIRILDDQGVVITPPRTTASSFEIP